MTAFTLDKKDGIATITMDYVGQAQNVLNNEIQDEYETIMADIEADPELRGLIFASAKPDCFLAGADINLLQGIKTAEQAEANSKRLHAMTQRIADMPLVTVAAIHGICLGGGLELSLAFDYRVASTAASTRIGVPEVQLGILPGGGGTQRIPRLIDLPTALDMMLTGRQLSAKRAKSVGLVDQIVAPEVLLDVAQTYVPKGKPRRKPSLKHKIMVGPARKLIIAQARKKALKMTKGHYPAPLMILETVDDGLATDLPAGLDIEARNFAQLLMSPESKQLVNIFFATTDLKKDSGVDSDAEPREVNKVGVLGAGLMGAGISAVTIEKAAKRVRLKDISAAGLANGIGYVGKLLDKKVARRRMPANRRDQIMSRLTGSTDYSGFGNAEVVIEAVFESLELKRQMVSDIEQVARGVETVFATNTSAIPIDDIAKGAAHPERVIGMHYFSPVEKMPLLEVINGSATADWVTATAVELGKRQGKTVIVVNDGPGFYTTRILVPYNMEAVRLVLEGVAIEAVDNALEEFGFPVGPIKLMDEVGIDVGAHIVETLHEAFGERVPLIEGIETLIGDDRKGKKNGRGFYDYQGKSKGKEVDQSIYNLIGVSDPGSNEMASQVIAERVVLTMLNEAAWCLGEDILRSARDGDIGAIFGLGFPPFRGGPFRYMETLGLATVVDKLEALQAEHGKRFAPAPLLKELAASDKTFYG
ncbi:MAG: fatty acid oxidation complex subunit alpha FadJ [Gammaproteobacteria bacterium]|nr:fatty acid oxidation complex subunit alpha FadJ [Gammaproteobacteria bacterium]